MEADRQGVPQAAEEGVGSRSKKVDDEAYKIRFTPRRPNSKWSAKNIASVERLIAAGRMLEPGLREFENRKQEGPGYAYEEKHVDIPPADAIDAILFRMEQRGMTRTDLQELLGVGRGRVSEVLNGKRGLSITMIRKLADQLQIPAATLIQPTR